MSFELGDQDTREDVRRVAAACERSNEQTDTIVSIAKERLMRDYGVPVEELRREARHHDVLCLVLREAIRGKIAISAKLNDQDVAEYVRGAHSAADLAYPPPKGEPKRLDAALRRIKDIEQSMETALLCTNLGIPLPDEGT